MSALSEFIDSWELFQNSWLAGGCVALLLALLGVIVVVRDQIFLGAAVSQASTFGIAIALALGAAFGVDSGVWFDSTSAHILLGSACAAGAALLTARAGSYGAPGRESSEAVTGWVFLACGSFSVLLLAHSPRGLEEVERLMASSLLGASDGEVLLLATLLAVSVALVLPLRRRLLLVLIDPEMAGAVGMRARLWLNVTWVWVGIAIAVSLHTSGMVYTFSCLVLPALVAKRLCREMRTLFLAAPVISLVANGAAFILAHHWDTPPGQTGVAVMSLVVLVAWAGTSLAERLRSMRR